MGFFAIFDQAIGTATGEVGVYFQLDPGKAAFSAIDYTSRQIGCCFTE